jgi:predicted nuclease of predicted toxin-antitoxin system
MRLRFFADHCVPNSVVRALRDAGHEVTILKDSLPCDSNDRAVIGKANELNAILVSLDADFADIVNYPPSSYKGIASLQVRNRPESIPALMERLAHYLSVHREMQDYEGRLFLVESHRIRVRR